MCIWRFIKGKKVRKMKGMKYIFQQIGFGLSVLGIILVVTASALISAMIGEFGWHILGKKYCKRCGEKLTRVGEIEDLKDFYVCLKCRDPENETTRTVLW